MAKNNSILQEAILEAKQVREAAINQAYESLKENLTPSIKALLESKLEESLDIDENLEEGNNYGEFKPVKVKAENNIKEAEEETSEDDAAEDADEAEDKAEDAEEDAEEAEADAEEADDDAEEAEDSAEDAEEAKEIDDETKIEDITVSDLKDIIGDVVAQATGAAAEPAPEGNLGADMEVADVEGAGEEDAPLEEPAADEIDATENPDAEVAADEADEEIDLAELLKELENEDMNEGAAISTDKRGKDHDNLDVEKCQDSETEDIKELKKENAKLQEGVEQLTKTLKDVNLLNSKLLYTSRLLSENNLSDSQKARIIRTLDEAKTPKQVKSSYRTLLESLSSSKSQVLREHKGMASRAAGLSTGMKAGKGILDADETVRRMQYLAGIINDD